MRIGLTYNLKPEHASGDQFEEFDSIETVEALEAALRACGHQPVRLGWGAPMLDALRAAGARNYSIFLNGDELFAYLEVEDFDAFRASMAATEVNDRWQAEMALLIDPLTDPETGFHRRLEEIFHLE